MQSMHHVAPPKSTPPKDHFGAHLLPDVSGLEIGTGIDSGSPELMIAPAVTYQQNRACGALVRRMYSWRGYRLSPPRQQLGDPNHVTLGAWQDRDLVATLTASRDSSEGLLADTLYGQEMAGLRKPARVICEVTRLAVDLDCHDPELLRLLPAAAWLYTSRITPYLSAGRSTSHPAASYARQPPLLASSSTQTNNDQPPTFGRLVICIEAP
ncbi:MAG: hypothetical protein H6R16_3623 [Proteobacteria bacterium]|nr:hypothetical protein [Pseudomonadota bacterium]